jgi:hypothetical protein
MGKHMVRIRLLALMIVVALVTSMSAGAADAASYPGAVRPAASTGAAVSAGAAATGSGLAPCTKPLFGSDKDCESTSPTVDRWVTFEGSADESCTYTQYVDWGDGSRSQRTFVDPTPDVTLLIASHRYRAAARTTTYTETVTSTVDAGTCNPISTTDFHFTYLVPVQVPWWTQYGITEACAHDLLPNPVEIALFLAQGGAALGLFVIPGGQFVGVLLTLNDAYAVFKLIRDCVQKSYPLIPLVHAFDYGVSHPGKLFKPKGTVLHRPQITGIYGYQKGSLVYFSLTYADPGHDAKGFGFVGIDGAGWAEENHPFSSPSYGIVGHDRIDYPFNLACGTPQQYKSWVEAWVYDSQGIRSNPVEIALSCTT